MGPQLGYFYPEIVLEASLRGPGIRARGAVAPGAPYVLIGRTQDYALEPDHGEQRQPRRVPRAALRRAPLPLPRALREHAPLRRRRAGGRRRRALAAPGLRHDGPRSRDRARRPSAASRTRSPRPRSTYGERRAVAGRPARHDARARPDRRRLLPARPTSSGSPSTGPTPPAATWPTSRPGASRGPSAASTSCCRALGTGRYDWKGFLPLRRAPARRRPARRAAAQLEQQARAGLAAGRRRPLLRLRAPRRAVRRLARAAPGSRTSPRS